MDSLPRLIRVFAMAVCAVGLIQIAPAPARLEAAQGAGTTRRAAAVRLLAWTDRGTYSARDTVKLNAALRNDGDAAVYVDRRMFWTGYGGGLAVEITDQQGKRLPARLLSDAIMPPPNPGDTSILVRLDDGFFYGTSVTFKVGDFLPTPGRYSIKVTYQSWLRRDSVAAQLRSLPALWAESPAINSDRVWIEVTR